MSRGIVSELSNSFNEKAGGSGNFKKSPEDGFNFAEILAKSGSL
jgi:hypothetical protein